MDERSGMTLPTAAEAAQPERYLMEAANGQMVWVPADKLEAWEAAQQRGTLSPGILKYKQQIKDRILQEIYGSKK